ncbi:MAG TPA: LLM class flavin-dependent oxidoreductase [Methylomirabilota bacterium]|nr:LLM class flavin-dependent oxidoreductase [Methylomirabilota bacterium]
MKLGLSPLQAGGDFEETIQECERAEAAGFDSVWLGEHHNNPVLYPTPLIGLAAIASRTRRLRLGTGVLLAPLYHPLTVAEQAAMVDVISRGRLILGVGAGYAPEEFAAFGVSLKERGSRMDEAMSLIDRLLSEEKVTHAGRHYRVTEATVAPRPVQRPRPPIWFAGWVEPAIRRAGRMGDAWLGGPSARLDELAACVRLYRQARAAAGRDAAGGELALMRYVHVAESSERARAIAGPAFVRSFESLYFRWPHPVVKRPAGELSIERLSEDRIILGDPESCIRQIERFRTALGVTHLICRMSVPGISREAARAALDLFTREVMPALA